MTATPALFTHRSIVEAAHHEARLVPLVRAHLPFVWRFLRRLGLSPEDADDVAQETFLVAVNKLDRIETGQERSFLFGVAVRIASRSRRSRRSREARTMDDHDVDACRSPDLATDELIARKEAREVLDEILSEMTPPLRTAFVLFELEEMTMVEIAALTDTPAGTVASRIRRAREQFQAAARVRQARV
jgi:RNA polymerase sigma-70 factor, ECF subfamily